VTARHRDALAAAGADGTATFILGGRIAGGPADILLVYPEGNDIRASDERPFLQSRSAAPTRSTCTSTASRPTRRCSRGCARCGSAT
jgi:predicted proteasome-type protease